ncbi:unannotated protein [freshwater metagenome]|uniref:Unannotated protein n=1 Tax=freshwater metagenome TaxID=449393 RepID=A0A6J7FTN5_9ZZZZ|nr:N-6 DNA methylase [Actinomycetota bacterium]
MARTFPLRTALVSHPGPRTLTACALAALYLLRDQDHAPDGAAGAWDRTLQPETAAAQQRQATLELHALANLLPDTPGPLAPIADLRLAEISAHDWPRLLSAVARLCDDCAGELGGAMARVVLECAGSDPWATDFFPTPPCLCRTLGMVCDPGEEEWIVDPAAGTGSLLATVYLDCVKRDGRELADARTWLGVELATIAALQMLAVGAWHSCWIAAGNALTQQLVGEAPDGRLRQLHPSLVLANPPFNSKVTRSSLEHAPTHPLIVPTSLLYRQVLRRRHPATAAVAAD